MRRLRAKGLPLLALSLGLLAASCGGGGSAIVLPGSLVAIFVPDDAFGDPQVSMEAEAGAAATDVFSVEIHAGGIDDVAGVAFTLIYEPALAEFVGCEATGSIFLSNPSLTNPCDLTTVGGAIFKAELQNDVPGILNVGASLEGLVAGVPGGTGLVLTLTFRALDETPGTDLEFELGVSRLVQVCPSTTTCVPSSVNWDQGQLIATAT